MLKRSAQSFKRSHFILVSSLLTIGFFLVMVRLIIIQGFQNDQWLKRAEQEHERNISIEAERGTIYDRAGNILAINVEVPSVYAIPNAIRNPAAASRILSPILKIDPKILLRKLNEEKSFVWLQRKIGPEKAREIEKHKIEGIGFVMESQRFYPKRALFGHLLGFAGLDNRGLEGVELKYDSSLRGAKGWLVVERDAHGKSIFPKGFDYIAPSRGKDIHMTVDEVIQHISERELDRVIDKTGAKGGTVIVMDPWSGEILSMAVRPRFNPNLVGEHHPSEWRNRAITDTYEPGSTLKIITASAALEEKVVTPNEMIDCEEGSYYTGGTVIHDHEPIGVVPFRQVVAKSSNIGTAKIAQRLGEERLVSYLRAFGFGERLGIDLIGESPGLVRDPKQWSKRSLVSMAMGQEIGVTPLQMVTAASVVANGGHLMTPHLIKEIREEEKRSDIRPVDQKSMPQGNRRFATFRASPQTQRRVISEGTAKEMVQILEEVVSKSGTAAQAAIPGYSVAGKTGTAQKFNPATGRYSPDRFVSSFVGFAPAEDPVVTILVIVDEPEGKGWGGTIAAPVFAAIGKEVLHYLKVPPMTVATEPVLTASLRETDDFSGGAVPIGILSRRPDPLVRKVSQGDRGPR
jgi:cell division protein FtsI (penicillin-binding protein 3)